MKKHFFFIGLILIITFSCKSQTQGVKNISVTDLQMLLKSDKNIQLIDVRTPKEWVKGIIQNAIKINVTATNFENIALENLDKTKPVYLYCKSGVRSKKASQLLLKNGFKPYNILGGYMAWKEKNKD